MWVVVATRMGVRVATWLALHVRVSVTVRSHHSDRSRCGCLVIIHTGFADVSSSLRHVAGLLLLHTGLGYIISAQAGVWPHHCHCSHVGTWGIVVAHTGALGCFVLITQQERVWPGCRSRRL